MENDIYSMTRSPTKSPSVLRRSFIRPNDGAMTSQTMYQDYPPSKPFINDDYRISPTKPIKAYPESNRQAVMSALCSLRDKIHKLELERSAAEDNLKSLATETTKYKDILQQEQKNQDATESMLSRQTNDMKTQLSSAETRCDLLEKQLDYMRKMVQTAEQDKLQALKKNRLLDNHHDFSPVGVKAQMDKIHDLEREHLKLTATQTVAENKIHELEEKLLEERHHRNYMQTKANEMAAIEEANRLFKQSSQPPKSKKLGKKRKKKIISKKITEPFEPTKHFRLNLAEIPFVAGRSTGPSHSVGANVQKVLALMKSHNLALCSDHWEGSRPSSSGSSASSSSMETDLADLLLQLQDEFGLMSSEHQELAQQANEETDYRIQEDLERELESLVSRMEAKGQQISKVRRHQHMHAERRKKKKSRKKEKPSRPQSARAATPSKTNEVDVVEVTTTIRTKGSGKIKVNPTSLNILKDMKKLQTTLRKDDLSWE